MPKKEWDKAQSESYPFKLIMCFDGGETKTEQENFMRESFAYFAFTNSEALSRRVSDIEYELSFQTFAGFAKFHLKFLGDTKYIPTECVVDFAKSVDTRWIIAAKSFCDTAGLAPEIRVSDNQVVLKFKYFGEMVKFRLAMENNEIVPQPEVLNSVDDPNDKNKESGQKPILKQYHPVYG